MILYFPCMLGDFIQEWEDQPPQSSDSRDAAINDV